MRSSRLLWTKLATIATGLITTLLVAMAFHLGMLSRFESIFIDLRHRLFQTVDDSGKICIIGVDDNSLAAIGQWPWPRSHFAQIIDLVAELGGGPILVDFTYTKPSGKTAPLPDLTAPAVDEDAQLAQAFERHGNILLAFFFNKPPPHPQAIAALEDDITLAPEQLSERTGLSPQTLRDSYTTVRRQAARRLAVKALRDTPKLTPAQFLTRHLGRKWTRATDERRELQNAYAYAHAYLTVQAKGGLLPQAGQPRAGVRTATAHGVPQIPITVLAHAAKDVGFVDYHEEDSDGKLRALSLLALNDNVIYRQLALATASRHLGITDKPLNLGDRTIRLGSATDTQAPISIPLTSDNKLIINWYYKRTGSWPSRPDVAERSFPDQLPAGKLLDVAFARRQLRQNRYYLNEAVGLAINEFMPARYAKYVKLKSHIRLLETAVATQPTTASSTAPATQPAMTVDDVNRQDLAKARRELAKLTEQAKEEADRAYQEVGGDDPLIAGLWRCLFEPDQVRKTNGELATLIDEQVNLIRPRIENKIVLLGYTAAALADSVPTPVFDTRPCPGVIVHANIINQILQNDFLTESRTSTDLLVILVMGTIASVVTASQKSGLQGFAWMLILLLGFLAVTFLLVFAQWQIICNVSGPILATFLSWSLVTLYYQITEGRAKRLFALRLGQYTNTSLVKRIVEDPSRRVLVPQAQHVTCFFSDLAGFTSLSEQLQPDKVVLLLNIYLEHMSEILDRHEGFINKFEGDGIFAFFNPPLNPQADHARRACLAAIDCQTCLAHVDDHLRQVGFDLPGPLRMRIGISSGPVVVGDCGSARKFDYTCLGDTVNLSSRLEAANKFFATRIMISEYTHTHLDDQLLTRLLGTIRVVGREQPVVVYELIDLEDHDDDRRQFVDAFDELVRLYWNAQFDQAAKLADELSQSPLGQTDPPLAIYRELIKTPQLHRQGIIELESK